MSIFEESLRKAKGELSQGIYACVLYMCALFEQEMQECHLIFWTSLIQLRPWTLRGMCRSMISVTGANWGICVQTVVVWPQKTELCAWPICMRQVQLTVVGASKSAYLRVVWWQGSHWLGSDLHIRYGSGCIDGPFWSVFMHCFPGFQHLVLCAGKLIVCSFCTYLVLSTAIVLTAVLIFKLILLDRQACSYVSVLFNWCKTFTSAFMASVHSLGCQKSMQWTIGHSVMWCLIQRMEKYRPEYLCSLLEWFHTCMSQCVSVFVTSLSTDKPASSLLLWVAWNG